MIIAGKDKEPVLNEEKINEDNVKDNNIYDKSSENYFKLFSHRENDKKIGFHLRRKKEMIQKNELLKEEKEIKDQRPLISALDILLMKSFKCCVKERHKYSLLEKCLNLVTEFTQIDAIIKTQIEVIFLRKLVLNESQNMLFQYLFKNIDFDNANLTLKFLNELIDRNPSIDMNKVKKMNRDNPIDKYLLQKFDEYMFKKN
jgi:hypothetical protein